MATVQERVRQLIEHKGLTVNAFENMCGLANGTVSKMGKGTRRGTFDKIFTAFPNINKDWLLYGEGEMICGENSTKQGAPNQPDVTTGNQLAEMFTKMLSAINDIRSNQIKCEEMLQKAQNIMDNATSIMNNAIQLNSDMQQDHRDTKKLYDDIHDVQQEHIKKSQERLIGQQASIVKLRDEIKSMIDNQTVATEENAKQNTERIIGSCESAKVDDIRKGVNTLLIYHKLPVDGAKIN